MATSGPAPAASAHPARRNNTRLHLFSRQLLSRTFTLQAHTIGTPAVRGLADAARELEGKCTAEGLIRHGSTTIAEYSAGVCDGGKISYNVKVECDICSPVPGQRINKCEVVSVTKVGIKAIKPPAPGPVTIFVLRDHYGDSEYYATLKEGDIIDVVVTAPRFQLNDQTITVLSDLVPKQPYTRLVIQPN